MFRVGKYLQLETREICREMKSADIDVLAITQPILRCEIQDYRMIRKAEKILQDMGVE